MLRASCLVLVLLGCGETDHTAAPAPRTSGPLVNVFDWTVTAPGEDPFAEFWSDQVRCPDSEHGPENLGGVWAYSIETGACNWLTIEHPSLSAVRTGDFVRAAVWHFTLSAPEPAFARVGLATADGVLSNDEPIHSRAALWSWSSPSRHRSLKGLPSIFTSDHGANSWHPK